jgi:lipoprotein-anchoring transpeptidase ErfK/SrfK
VTRHRLEQVRPRYGRMLLAVASTGVTGVAVLGGVGVLPVAQAGGAGHTRDAGLSTAEAATSSSVTPTTPTPVVRPEEEEATTTPVDDALPAGSGEGRRVVFSESRQRVWLVGDDGTVASTYLVSGSIHDNLDPGEYAVYSRSEQAWGIDDSGTMRWFVRFTQGDNAAIGFHDIPVDEGRRVQTVAQLGTPLSHGCIRQRRADARRLWAFAPIGTKVVVTA